MNIQAKAEMAVHPLAALFPMMPDDELADLVADIKANGLLNPLIKDEAGQLIDGRNRLRACEMAGIEPRWEIYSGDAVAYIWSANELRRHMSKGQRAMVSIMADPEGHQGQHHVKNTEVNGNYLSRARIIWKHAEELCVPVRDGVMSISDAYEIAKRNKAATDSAPVITERLRHDAPDLADMVLQDQLKLSEALAAYQARQSQDLTECKAATTNLSRIISPLFMNDIPPEILARRLFGRLSPEFWPGDGPPLTADALRTCAAVISATATMLEKGEHRPWQRSEPFHSEQ
jgi:hypothetical protein